MSSKNLLVFVVLLTMTFSAESQRLKVKRKGVTPPDVNKNIQTNNSTYTLQQFAGKWQEVKRTNEKGTGVDFSDTLFYNFSGENVFSRDGVNMSLRGEAVIDPGNILVAAADVFTIKALNNKQAVLDDGDYVHTLIRKNSFWYESLPTNAVTQEKFTTPISVNTSAITGKWKVYRRDAKPGTNDKVLIRILNITNIKNDNNASGEITFYKTEKLETLPCTITLDGGKMHITTEKNTWDVSVYKADGKDLVFGDDSLMYYCKPL